MIKLLNNKMLETIDVTEIKEEKKEHTKSKKHDFLLSAKNLYLTYSNCSLELSKILGVLRDQSSYDIKDFYLSREMYKALIGYIQKRKKGENPVLAIVGEAGTGKTNFLISFFEQVLNCQVIVVKNN